MSKNHILGYLAAGAGIGALYLLVNKLYESRQVKIKAQVNDPISVDLVRQIAQQIKYQMLIVCFKFLKQFDKKFKGGNSPTETQILTAKLRRSITNFYEQKQALILRKYQVQKEDYGGCLIKYENDEILSSIKTEIMNMMEAAVEGRIPDITVPTQALGFFTLDEVVKTYEGVSELVIMSVWKKIIEFMQREPEFDLQNEDHYARMIRQVGVYDLKRNFMLEKGYKTEWGYPNEIFLKVIENLKISNAEFRKSIVAIEYSYEASLDKITQPPLDLEVQKVKAFFSSEINRFRQIEDQQNQ